MRVESRILAELKTIDNFLRENQEVLHANRTLLSGLENGEHELIFEPYTGTLYKPDSKAASFIQDCKFPKVTLTKTRNNIEYNDVTGMELDETALNFLVHSIPRS